MMRRIILLVVLLAAAGCRRQLDDATREATTLLQETVLCAGDPGEGCNDRGNYLCLGVVTRRLVTCSGDTDEQCAVVTLAAPPAEQP